MNLIRHILTFFSLLFLGFTLSNQGCACQILERSYPSPAIGRDEAYLILMPDAGVPVLGAVYFLHGASRDRHFIRDLGACEQIDRLARESGKSLMIIAPDGGVGYWMNAAHTSDRYRDLVAQEMVAKAETEFPFLERTPKKRILAGISMGGHGAIQISINSPGIFGSVGAHSPVFRTQEETNQEYPLQFGTGADYQSRDPFSLILIQGKSFTGPLYIDMGGQDPWVFNTRNFQNLMQARTVSGIFKVGVDQVGGHADGYWQYHLPEYFDWYFSQLSMN